ncbi:MAG: copper amine oxidase N-terminal domain-containing protein, partial [Clostridia bacterium]|nr:copper amine oxidase N-terminal domain-containing protein [Clostridia bacterium]
IGLPYAIVNGEYEALDCAPFIENERTYTPVRLIAESLGARVDWDGSTQSVIITR